MADITRAEVASLIAEEYAPQTIKAAIAGSVALQAFPRVSLGTKTTHIPVLATVPEADWVTDTDNTGVKPTSQATWQNKTLVAEEIAVIVPIHENTLADATEDVLAQIAELGGQAIGKKFDEAVLFGNDKPASWTSSDIFAAAVAAGQDFEVSTHEDDLYGSILQAAGVVADAGFDPSTLIAKRSLAFSLANIRTSEGALVLTDDGIRGFDTLWSRNGAWDAAAATSFVVDPSVVRVGVREDITVKFLDQATLTGVGNLAEKDMVALRIKARLAYVLGTPVGKTGVAAVVPAGS